MTEKTGYYSKRVIDLTYEHSCSFHRAEPFEIKECIDPISSNILRKRDFPPFGV